MTMRIGYALTLLVALSLSCSSGGDSGETDIAKNTDVEEASDSLQPDVAAEDVPMETATDIPGDVGPTPLENLLPHVDPMIGTGGLSYRLGSAFVGATVPFGLAKVGPDTKHAAWGEPSFTHCEGYWYPDTHVAGFAHLHIHGTGAPDYGSLLTVPSIGMDETKVTEEGYMLPLDHDKEINEPGYYGLILGTPSMKAEMTATTRVGVHRYTYPVTEDAVVIIDPSHVIASCDVDDTEITVDPEAGTFEGWLHTGCSLSGRFGGYTMYFYGEFRRTPTTAGVWQDDQLIDGTHAVGDETGAWFRFDATEDHEVNFALAISFVDIAHAKTSMKNEVGEKSFDDIRDATQQEWNEALHRGLVHFPEDTPNDVRIQYYTSLYHAFLMPTIWSESDGSYIAFDGSIQVANGYTFYTDFSMWDTYRTLHPLLFLMFPEESGHMVRSLLEMAKYSGCLPKWVLANGDGGSMIGRPASIIVADAFLHGLAIQDEGAMYQILANSHDESANGEPVPDCSGKDGYHSYKQYGYHPYDLEGGSVAKTQEIAWADYCVAQVAETMDNDDQALLFFHRSMNPYNLYNPDEGFFMGKDSQGNWVEGLDRFFWEDYYVEGNAWQYLWLMAHDPAGLAETLGGVDTFFARLDEFFDETKAWDNPVVPPNHYFQGNEPDIHAPFLYSAMGRPASSAEWSRWIMDKEFYVDPEGLAGNDDAGTMAAWYAFATLGFYPYPCTKRYMLGSPRVSEAWITSLGEPLHIVVTNPAEENLYIESVIWNDEEVTTPWITIEQLQAGGEVVFTMAPEPTDFGTGVTFEPLWNQYPLD